jgi:DNA-directed RNA polymerase specialized sigma subunit
MPHRKEEFLSVALYELVRALHRFPEKQRDGKLTPYIRMILKYTLRDVIGQGAITVPPRSFRRKPRSITYVSIDECDRVIQHFFSIEMIEVLDRCICRDIEQQILDMRLMGYNDREIGEILGRPKQTISHIRGNIRRKLKEYYDVDR